MEGHGGASPSPVQRSSGADHPSGTAGTHAHELDELASSPASDGSEPPAPLELLDELVASVLPPAMGLVDVSGVVHPHRTNAIALTETVTRGNSTIASTSCERGLGSGARAVSTARAGPAFLEYE